MGADVCRGSLRLGFVVKGVYTISVRVGSKRVLHGVCFDSDIGGSANSGIWRSSYDNVHTLIIHRRRC